MIKRKRADRLLVERGLFESRAKAQAAIAAGGVTADGVPVAQPSDEVAIDAAISAAPAHPWVSRGGVKLAAALDHLGFDPASRVCLDVGASTGGFTEVLLARGARASMRSMSGAASYTRACASVRRSSRWKRPTSARSTCDACRAAGFRHDRCQLHLAQAGAAGARWRCCAARLTCRADQAAIRGRRSALEERHRARSGCACGGLRRYGGISRHARLEESRRLPLADRRQRRQPRILRRSAAWLSG